MKKGTFCIAVEGYPFIFIFAFSALIWTRTRANSRPELMP